MTGDVDVDAGSRPPGWAVVRFGELQIAYASSVLPPRPWTAAQSQWAVELAGPRPPGPILELFAGSGQIGILAAVRSGRPLVAVDVNPVAVTCARHNAIAAGLAGRADIRHSDIESAVAEQETFSVILADPPWVPSDDVAGFPLDPPLAIDGGDDGMGPALACLGVVEASLRPGGAAVVQLGSSGQVRRLRDHLVAQRIGLTVTEHRAFPGRGDLVRLDRPG